MPPRHPVTEEEHQLIKEVAETDSRLAKYAEEMLNHVEVDKEAASER